MLEIFHNLHDRRRGGKAEVLGDKLGIEIDARGDFGDQMRGIQALERFAAVRELALCHDHREHFTDTAVIEHKVTAGQRKLRFQHQCRGIGQGKAFAKLQKKADGRTHTGRNVFFITDSNKEQSRFRVLR